MRLIFATRGDAQAFCDRVHAQLQATNNAYARSVAAGQTLQWDVPRANFDENGNPQNNFYVFVQERCRPVLAAPEEAAIVTTESRPPP